MRCSYNQPEYKGDMCYLREHFVEVAYHMHILFQEPFHPLCLHLMLSVVYSYGSIIMIIASIMYESVTYMGYAISDPMCPE